MSNKRAARYQPESILFEWNRNPTEDDAEFGRALNILIELMPVIDYRRVREIVHEIRELYWTTDIPLKELRDAYLPGRANSFVTTLAGPVKLAALNGPVKTGRLCATCGNQIYVWKRSDIDHYDGEQLYRGCCRCRACVRNKIYTTEYLTEWFEREPSVMESFLSQPKIVAQYFPHYAPLLPPPPPVEPTPPERMPYQDYLLSAGWQERRAGALRRAGFACQVCAAESELHVHHRTYARRGNEADTDLIVLCAECHEIFHANGKLAGGGRALP